MAMERVIRTPSSAAVAHCKLMGWDVLRVEPHPQNPLRPMYVLPWEAERDLRAFNIISDGLAHESKLALERLAHLQVNSK